MEKENINVDKLFTSSGEVFSWEPCAKLIAEKLGSQTYQTWFSHLRFGALEKGNLTLIAPNAFIADFVEQHYAEVIKNAVYSHLHADCSVTFTVSDPAENEKIVTQISAGIETTAAPPPGEARAWGGPPATDPARAGIFTFDNFVIGSNNQFAYNAARAVAEAPGKTNFNPLIVYGKTGLGKTHLLQSIEHFARTEETADQILYVTSVQFLNDYVHFVHKVKKSHEFYRRYQDIDVLLIDDIHFLSGKAETQNQFYRIFEALTAQKKQVVITSDRHPHQIKDLNVRLLNRFSGGLLVDIQPPGYETRMAILEKKAEQQGILLPPDVLQMLADCPTENVRELDGLLIRVLAYSNFFGQDITVDLLRQVLGDAVVTFRAPVTTEDILSQVAKEFNISKPKLCAHSRSRDVAVPRQISMYLCKKYTNNSLATIGVTFNRNHSTVIHALKKCEEILKTDRELAEKVENIERRLGSQ